MPSTNPYSPSTAEPKAEKSHTRVRAALYVTLAVATIGSLALCSIADPFIAGLSFVPFAFGPLAITVVLSFMFRSANAQAVLAISSVSYAAWFGYIYVQAFYINPDPQSPIVLLFVGVAALPVLALFWLTAGILQWRAENVMGESSIRNATRPRWTSSPSLR